ncbi:MAG: serine/threonine-protein kinase [Caldilineaceae bacterium]
MLEIGQRLQQDRYEIEKPIDGGGQGRVYRAIDHNLQKKKIAIKENIETSPEAPKYFEREAALLARLSHPNLPRVTDYFIEQGQYLVMDYIGGDNLKRIKDKHKGFLPEADVLAWIKQVMDALDYMHSWVDPDTNKPRPIVHRDIKPSNIKRTPNGRIYLVDFGSAKYQIASGSRSRMHDVSDGFSPPEQYEGNADIRSDIYALGATLYALLTSKSPPNSRIITDGGKHKLQSPRKFNPRISRNTERVILRAMKIRPTERFQTIKEMRSALIEKRWSRNPSPANGALRLVMVILLFAVISVGVIAYIPHPYPPITLLPTSTPFVIQAPNDQAFKKVVETYHIAEKAILGLDNAAFSNLPHVAMDKAFLELLNKFIELRNQKRVVKKLDITFEIRQVIAYNGVVDVCVRESYILDDSANGSQTYTFENTVYKLKLAEHQWKVAEIQPGSSCIAS